jgi:putative salt-induced outer membrane protein YdiY
LEFDTTDGEKTTDKWSTYNQYSRLFPSRWYGAAWLAFKHDRFADLRLRTMGGPAIGYLAYESEALNLSVELGPTVLEDDYYDNVDHESLGTSLSLNYDQLLWRGRLQPYHRQFSYVALDGENKFLWQSWTGLRVPLGGGFIGSLEFEYDYDSTPAVNAKTTDTSLRLKLGYQW